GRIGTSDPLELAASPRDIAENFGFDKLGRAPARYDTADLDRLNAAALHAMDYAAARPRLEALGCDLGEGFWLAVRPNLARLGEAADWARILTGQIDPAP